MCGYEKSQAEVMCVGEVRFDWAAILVYLQLVPVGAEGKGPVLHRQKRHWISPPRHLKENHDYTGQEYIARVCHLLLHCLRITWVTFF